MKKADFFHTTQQKRILQIDRLLREPGGKTREQICTALKNHGYAASRHTFLRDIDHMRHDLGAPIGYDDRVSPAVPQGHATFWFYQDRTWTLKDFQVTDDVLFSLLVASKVVERYAGHPLAQDLKAAYDKLGEALNRKVSMSADHLAPVSFFPEPCQQIEPSSWKPVLKAVTTQKMLAMEYKSAWGKEAKKDKQRTIHPYHIVNLSGTWYLIGSRSEDDMSFRQYAISGISKARVLEKRADIPADFDVEEILDVTFGRFLGDPRQVVSVKVRLSQRVAPLVEGRVFSKKQELRTLPSGDIELSFPASTAGPWPLYHVKGWVLSWGADCEVLEPAELRELVRKDLDAMRDTIARSGDHQRCRNCSADILRP